MYDHAGKFLVNMGLPIKCGLSGGLISVIPGIGSMASLSPKLNKDLNSVKGIALVEKLSGHYKNFNLFHKDHRKKDILAKPYHTIINTVTEAI